MTGQSPDKPESTAADAAGAALLQGAAAIEPGVPAELVLQALAQANPGAALRAAENARLRAEHAAQLAECLRTRFGAEIGGAAAGGPLIAAERHFELARVLKEELGYRFYVTTCASHWPAQKGKTSDDPEHFEVATVLRVPGPGSCDVRWRVRVAIDGELDSLVPLFAGADWQEREQFDLFGVRFRGHPDLRRLMMPDEWEGHPLRKDYPIDTRCEPWR
jgi:NADH-quinone oxidoreductase subunit C